MTYVIEELEDGRHSREIGSYSTLDKALKDLLILIESNTEKGYRLWQQEGNVRKIIETFKGSEQ